MDKGVSDLILQGQFPRAQSRERKVREGGQGQTEKMTDRPQPCLTKSVPDVTWPLFLVFPVRNKEVCTNMGSRNRTIDNAVCNIIIML